MKIKVKITGHDPGYPSVDCPLRNGEFSICQAWRFLHPQSKSDLQCQIGYEVEEGPDVGMYVYLVPPECPLRGHPLVVEGT